MWVHEKEKCPGKDKECNKCHRFGLFAIKCRTGLVQEVTVEVDSLFLGSVSETATEKGATVDEVTADTEPPWRTTFVMGRTEVNFEIDSGADTTLINEATYSRLYVKPKLRPVIAKLDRRTGGP